MPIVPTDCPFFRASCAHALAREIADFATGEPLARRRHAPSADIADRPVSNAASLVIALAQNGCSEGHAPGAETLRPTSGSAADRLGADIASLAALLHELRRRGLIAR